MRVVVVAKTHMGQNICVGAVQEEDGTLLRLIPAESPQYHSWRSFRAPIAKVLNLSGSFASDSEEPHVEDFLVPSASITETNYSITHLHSWLDATCQVWEGSPSILFDGTLEHTQSGTHYLSEDSESRPDHSVGFWRLPWRLTRVASQYDAKPRYVGPDGQFGAKYVGLSHPIEFIPRDAIVRLSLARWFSRNSDEPRKCWIQLSGWYLDDHPLPHDEHLEHEFDSHLPAHEHPPMTEDDIPF
jgi:hypothetical protein